MLWPIQPHHANVYELATPQVPVIMYIIIGDYYPPQNEERMLKKCGIYLSNIDCDKKITISIDLRQLSQYFPQVRAAKGLKLKIIKI